MSEIEAKLLAAVEKLTAKVERLEEMFSFPLVPERKEPTDKK